MAGAFCLTLSGIARITERIAERVSMDIEFL
jgi:hypothetical protein